jgi:L-iditol 2-dehydrogenase
MRAILYKDRAAALAEVPVPEPGPGELVVAVDACGLCGTDVMKLATRPDAAVLGHEICGRVARTGAGVRGFAEGDRVVAAHHVPCGDCHYCRRGSVSMCRQFKATNVDPGGFTEFVRLSALHARHTTFRVPESVDPAAASQMEPLACCLRNAKRIKAREGDVIGIVGLGAIGQLTARLLNRAFGATVVGLDLDAARAASLSSYGKGFTTFEDFEASTSSLSERRGLDTLIMSAGTPALAARAARLVRDGGTFNVFASFHPDPIMPLDLNQVYHRELTILSSYSPDLADLRESLDLIVSGRVDPVFADQKTYALEQFSTAVDDVKARRATKAILAPAAVASR